MRLLGRAALVAVVASVCIGVIGSDALPADPLVLAAGLVFVMVASLYIVMA